MPNIKVKIDVEVDGKSLDGYPVVRRLTVDELQSFKYEKATGGGYTLVPAAQLGEIQALILTADQPLTLRLDGQTDAGLVMNAGALVILMDVDIDAGAGVNNASLDNGSGNTALVKGLAGGT